VPAIRPIVTNAVAHRAQPIRCEHDERDQSDVSRSGWQRDERASERQQSGDEHGAGPMSIEKVLPSVQHGMRDGEALQPACAEAVGEQRAEELAGGRDEHGDMSKKRETSPEPDGEAWRVCLLLLTRECLLKQAANRLLSEVGVRPFPARERPQDCPRVFRLLDTLVRKAGRRTPVKRARQDARSDASRDATRSIGALV
jgi:hypothetical protein